MECDIAWPSRWLQNTTNTNTNSTHYWMEILTTMSPNESRSWNQFCNVTRLSSKKTNARENCFFSFCKMIFMTFQKSILDLKSLNICRHIDMLPEFKIMHFDGSWIFKKCALPPAHNFLAIVEIEITFNHQPAVFCSLPWQTEKMRKSFVRKIVQTKVQNLNF